MGVRVTGGGTPDRRKDLTVCQACMRADQGLPDEEHCGDCSCCTP
jgi:hypothetical protein